MSGKASSSSSRWSSGSSGPSVSSGSLIGSLARFAALVLLATLVLGVLGWLVHPAYDRLLAAVGGGLIRVVEPAADDTRLEATEGGIEVHSAYSGPAGFVVDSLEMHLSAPLALALLLVGGPARRTLRQRARRLAGGGLLVLAGHLAALIALVEFTPLETAGYRGAAYYLMRFAWWVGPIWGFLLMPAAAALYVYLSDWRGVGAPERRPGSTLPAWKVGAAVAGVLVLEAAVLAHLRPALPAPGAAAPSSVDGVAAFEAGRYAEAAEAFRRRLRSEPDDVTLRFNLGVSLYRMGSLAEAVLELEAVQRERPDYPHIDITLGAARFDAGDRVRGIADFQRADLAEETDVTLLLQVASALTTAPDLPRAELAYRRALELAPENATVVYRLGTVVMAQGRTDEAASDFERAVQLRPDYLEAWKYLALAHQQAGRLDRAAGAYHQALGIAPRDLAALSGLGTLLMHSQDPCLGLEFLERCAAAPGPADQQAACRERADRLAETCPARGRASSAPPS